MVISSRTPEGDPNHCGVCGEEISTESSSFPTRDAPCPNCGNLLWFTKKSKEDLEPPRKRVNRLSSEIAALSEMDLPSSDYFHQFLQRLLAALVAPAGAVWLRKKDGKLELQHEIRMRLYGMGQNVAHRQMNDELIRRVMLKGQPVLLSPQSVEGKLESGRTASGNPTTYVLLIAPISLEKDIVGLIEVWQDASRGPDAQRGFLQFMCRMASLASRFVTVNNQWTKN